MITKQNVKNQARDLTWDSWEQDFCHGQQSLEWKWSGKVERQTCTGLHARAKYAGNYENHECTIEINNVSAEDAGVWSCDIGKKNH